MQVTINGAGDLSDPRNRVLALEAATRAICQEAGQDPADGTMMLLTAAVHMASQYTKQPINEMVITLAEALGAATVAADDFFKLRAAS